MVIKADPKERMVTKIRACIATDKSSVSVPRSIIGPVCIKAGTFTRDGDEIKNDFAHKLAGKNNNNKPVASSIFFQGYVL
jgi:hypothetical protein